MKNAYFGIFLFILLSLLSFNDAAIPHSEGLKDTVLLISIDGFRPEYLERGLTPTLVSLANRGIMADSMMPQFPSLTFPNHFCIATGMYPINHGIVHNRFYDPLLKKAFSYTNPTESDPQWWLGEPIWNTVQKFHKKSGCMFWPGSDVEIMGKRPNYSFVYDEKASSKARVNKIIEWLMLPVGKRPSFMTLYFSMVDSAGHKFGPNSEEVNEALAEVDIAINYLVTRLKEIKMYSKINIIIVSDHGMIETKTNPLLIIDHFIEPKKIQWFESGPVATITPNNINDIYSIFTALKSSIECERSLFEVYFKEDLPAEYNYSNSLRVPQLVLIAKPGYYFTSLEIIQRKECSVFVKGQHGYPVSKENKDIHAIFIGHGPKFPSNTQSFKYPQRRLGTFSNLELFPLFLHLLQIPEDYRDASGELVKRLQNYDLGHSDILKRNE